jgi:DUF4097 and DUF4098 domain-containing protein YvlB
MRPLRIAHVLSVLVAAAGSTACSIDVRGNESSSREEKRFTVSASEPVDLQIRTFDGRISVRSWDKDEVLVEIDRRAPDQATAEALIVNEMQDGNKIVIEAPSDRAQRNVISIGGARSVNFTVTAPRRMTLQAHTGDGQVDARDLEGMLTLDSDDGRIEVSNVGGQLKAHTGDGIIRINQARGTVDADSGDGAIDIDGRLDVVTVRTGDGSVRVDAADGSNMKSEWRITTGDGRISLRVPNGFNAAVDASTGDGSVHVDGIPNASSKGGDSDRHRVAGQLGSGGAALTLRSGDGSIDVTH